MSWALGQASEHEIADREFKNRRYENYDIATGIFDGEEPSLNEIAVMLHIMKDEEIPQELEETWLKERGRL